MGVVALQATIRVTTRLGAMPPSYRIIAFQAISNNLVINKVDSFRSMMCNAYSLKGYTSLTWDVTPSIKVITLVA